MKKIALLGILALTATSCYNIKRNCADFKTGKFEFEYEIEGVKKKSSFVRTDSIEIDSYEGKTDTSSVRWINDCEFVIEKLRPKNMAEKQAVHMKILSTTKDSYTFEFSKLGDTKKQKGTVKKLE